MDRARPEIVRHYETIEEGRRLAEGLGQLELLRTQEVLCWGDRSESGSGERRGAGGTRSG